MKMFRIEKGIRQTGNTFSIDIELPPRKGRIEHSHSFHIGTVDNINDARIIRDKAFKLRTECSKDEIIQVLEDLKKEIRQQRVISKVVKSKLEDIESRLVTYADIVLNDEQKKSLEKAIACKCLKEII